MTLEEFTAELNSNVFFKEFSFSKNEYSPANGTNIEFADHVIWIDDVLIIFQLKERETVQSESEEAERNWFNNKVIHKATKQIRDTLQYFVDHEKIEITNEHGHRFDLKLGTATIAAKIVLYSTKNKLPEDCRNLQYYNSSTAGIIHIFPVESYLAICKTLVTPADIIEYLTFRESILKSYPTIRERVSEKALVGQFLSGFFDENPKEEFEEYVDQLDNSFDSFDLSGFFHSYKDSISYKVSSTSETDYYSIITQFAKMKRSGLREAKKRIELCVTASKKNEFRMPFRFFFPETNCGFVFIPLTNDLFEHRIDGLRNLTLAAKYEFKSLKQIGVSIVKKGDYFFIDWCFMEFPWERDLELETKLTENNPFRKVQDKLTDSFKFIK